MNRVDLPTRELWETISKNKMIKENEIESTGIFLFCFLSKNTTLVFLAFSLSELNLFSVQGFLLFAFISKTVFTYFFFFFYTKKNPNNKCLKNSCS